MYYFPRGPDARIAPADAAVPADAPVAKDAKLDLPLLPLDSNKKK